ncbi:MAG: hypothetical protein GX837_08190, partial [Methanomicrobiales archaeon]|nr:hypothetical protein [Methanomicrobiales archaeon]
MSPSNDEERELIAAVRSLLAQPGTLGMGREEATAKGEDTDSLTLEVDVQRDTIPETADEVNEHPELSPLQREDSVDVGPLADTAAKPGDSAEPLKFAEKNPVRAFFDWFTQIKPGYDEKPAITPPVETQAPHSQPEPSPPETEQSTDVRSLIDAVAKLGSSAESRKPAEKDPVRVLLNR